MQILSRAHFLQWGLPRAGGLTAAQVTDVEDLDDVIDQIEWSALAASISLQVDMWSPLVGPGDPILIQFLVGHAHRSSLLWHYDGSSDVAIDPRLEAWSIGLDYARVDGLYAMEPTCTQINPATVHDALTLYLLTNQRPDSLTWEEVPMD